MALAIWSGVLYDGGSWLVEGAVYQHRIDDAYAAPPSARPRKRCLAQSKEARKKGAEEESVRKNLLEKS